MKLEHLAIWTNNLEELKEYYVKYFLAIPNKKYRNPEKNFESYFLSFGSGARLEIMSKPGVPANLNDTETNQHLGIIHFAIELDSVDAVNVKAEELKAAGYKILDGPRRTGDGYYEFSTLDPDKNRLEVTTK